MWPGTPRGVPRVCHRPYLVPLLGALEMAVPCWSLRCFVAVCGALLGRAGVCCNRLRGPNFRRYGL